MERRLCASPALQRMRRRQRQCGWREDAGCSGPLAAPGREARLPRPRPPLDTDAEECCPYSPSYSFSYSHPQLGSVGMRSMSLVDEAKEGRGAVKGAVAAVEGVVASMSCSMCPALPPSRSDDAHDIIYGRRGVSPRPPSSPARPPETHCAQTQIRHRWDHTGGRRKP